MAKLLLVPAFRKMFEPSCRALTSKSLQKDTEPPKKPKVREYENRITLIAPDNSISIMDLVSAQNLSVRRELKLVKIQDADTKTRRPVYKLMTNAEYHQEELQRKKDKQNARQNQSKGDKLLTISSKIAQHDLMTRIKNAIKWAEKKYEVRVVIMSDDNDSMKLCENIYSIIESNLKPHGKIVQKRVKGNALRFQILPDMNKHTESDDTTTHTSQEEESAKKSSSGGEQGTL